MRCLTDQPQLVSLLSREEGTGTLDGEETVDVHTSLVLEGQLVDLESNTLILHIVIETDHYFTRIACVLSENGF